MSFDSLKRVDSVDALAGAAMTHDELETAVTMREYLGGRGGRGDTPHETPPTAASLAVLPTPRRPAGPTTGGTSSVHAQREVHGAPLLWGDSQSALDVGRDLFLAVAATAPLMIAMRDLESHCTVSTQRGFGPDTHRQNSATRHRWQQESAGSPLERRAGSVGARHRG